MKVREEQLLIWYYKTSNVELSEQIILWCSNNCYQLQRLRFMRKYFREISLRFRFFRLIHFREKVCKIRTKIFAHFCETFRSLETLDRTLIGLEQLLKLLGFSLYTLFYFAFTVPLNKAAVKITTLYLSQ